MHTLRCKVHITLLPHNLAYKNAILYDFCGLLAQLEPQDVGKHLLCNRHITATGVAEKH